MEVIFKPNGVSMSFQKSIRLFLSLSLLISTGINANNSVKLNFPGFIPEDVNLCHNFTPANAIDISQEVSKRVNDWYSRIKPNQQLRDFFEEERDLAVMPLRNGFFNYLKTQYSYTPTYIISKLREAGKATRAYGERIFNHYKSHDFDFDEKELFAAKIREIVQEHCEIIFVPHGAAACFAFRQLDSNALKVVIIYDNQTLKRYGLDEEARVGVMIHEATHGRDFADMEKSYQRMTCFFGNFYVGDHYISGGFTTPFVRLNEGFTDILGAATNATNGRLVTKGIKRLYEVVGDYDDRKSTHPTPSFRWANCEAVCEMHKKLQANPKK